MRDMIQNRTLSLMYSQSMIPGSYTALIIESTELALYLNCCYYICYYGIIRAYSHSVFNSRNFVYMDIRAMITILKGALRAAPFAR